MIRKLTLAALATLMAIAVLAAPAAADEFPARAFPGAVPEKDAPTEGIDAQGPILTCQANTTWPRSYATWGCGWAGTDANSLQSSFDDRRTDGSCVYLYVKIAGRWSYTGKRSCGAPGWANIDYPQGTVIQGVRLWRFSAYGYNYLTLPIQY